MGRKEGGLEGGGLECGLGLTSRDLVDLKALQKIYGSGVWTGGHCEQLGKLSGSTAGRLISPAQFFTPYFINKKAVKKTHHGRSCAVHHLEPPFIL